VTETKRRAARMHESLEGIVGLNGRAFGWHKDLSRINLLQLYNDLFSAGSKFISLTKLMW
jgi:hypothetical protein